MHKKILAFATAGIFALGIGGSVRAQDNAAPPAPEHRMHGRPMDPDTELAHLTKMLDLTADQQTQIKPLLVEQQQQMSALRQDQSLAPDDRRTKARAIGEETHKKIEALLTDEQKQKMQAMRERMRRGNGAPPSGDAQQ